MIDPTKPTEGFMPILVTGIYMETLPKFPVKMQMCLTKNPSFDMISFIPLIYETYIHPEMLGDVNTVRVRKVI